jgi:hypothetical protein
VRCHRYSYSSACSSKYSRMAFPICPIKT